MSYPSTLDEIEKNHSEMIQNKHVSKTIVSQNNSKVTYKKVTKESSRVALSGYLIDKSTAIETCRQGILLLNRGASR